MDGLSLGLKKLIFSKKDSPSTPSSRSGRERKRAFLSNSRRGQRDPSPFEEVRGNCFNLENKESEGKEIEDFVSAKEEIRSNDEDFEYRERDASGFEEIDWPDLEPESPSVEQTDEERNSVSPNEESNQAVQSDSKSPQTVIDGSVDGVLSRGENVGKNLDSNLPDKHDLETAESDDIVSENGYFERKRTLLRPEGSAVLSLSDSLQDELDDLEVRAERHKPLTKEQFLSFLDSDGRVVDETKLRRIIFKGGVEEEIREDVWQFLFELYPCNSTKREREVMNTEHSIRYKALKARWRPLLKQISSDPKSGVRYCPEWLHKRRISVVLETNMKASKEAVENATLNVADKSRGLLADTKSPGRQEHDLGQENKEAEQCLAACSGVAKVSRGTHDPLRKGDASFKMADDADIHPIADIHGSTVDDVRDAITEAMMEEPRITGIRSDVDQVKERKKRVEKDFHSNFKITCPICTQDVSRKCFCMKSERQFLELDTDFQELDANFQEISDIEDTKKDSLLDKKMNLNGECSYLIDDNRNVNDKVGEVKELGAVLQEVVLEDRDLNPEVDEDYRGTSSLGEQIPPLLGSSSDLPNENFVVSNTCKQTGLKSDNFPEGNKDILLDVEGGNTLVGKFQELEHGTDFFLEKEAKYEFSLETLLLSQDTSLCQFSELTDQSQMSVRGTEFPSFLEESKKETFYQEIEEAEASDTEEELMALQRDVNLSSQDDTVYSGLISFDRGLEASDWLEDDGRENEISIKGKSDLIMEDDIEMFSKGKKISYDKEVCRDEKSEFQVGSIEVRTGLMEEEIKEKSNIPSLISQTDFDKSGAVCDSNGPRTTKGDDPILTTLASYDTENTEMVDGPQTGDLIDFSPIKPTSFNLTDGRTDGQMPKWLEQQLQASSPAGTKTKRTINIHEAGLSHIEDMNSVMSVKEISEKASLVVKKKLIEQAKQPLRSSTPVQELEEIDNCVNVDNLYQETDDSPPGDEDSQNIGATEEAVMNLTSEESKRGLKLPSFARSTSVGDQEFVDPETGECQEDDDVIKPSSLIQSASLSNLHQHGLSSHDSPRKAYSAVDLIDNSRLNTGEYSAFNLLKNLDESISKSDSNVYNTDCRNRSSPIPELEKHDEGRCAYCGSHFENDKESLSDDFKKYVEIQAKVHAARQIYDLDVVTQGLRIIDKDVPRTDRDLAYFRGNENPNLLKLRDALITYAFFHPDVGYAQGMNDIMSRFFVVMDSEADAYWMFCNYMEHFKGDFMENDMLRKISLVEQLLMKMDRELYDFLQGLQMELIFCHRWLLLTFKREFSYKDGLRIFEIISSRHLEVSSLEAEMERSRERARELEKDEGSRMEEIYVSPEYSFDVFVCVAMLHECRDRLMSTNDVASIYQLMASLPNVNDLDTILSRAEDLFFKYCRKSTIDCFQVIDEPIEKALSWKQRLHIDF